MMLALLKYLTWVLAAGVKFLFVPPAMAAAQFPWWEIVVVCTVGAFISVCVFYFGADLAIDLSTRWRKKPRKKFTKFNRRIVRIKTKYGLKGLAFIGAFISVPVTAILAARFFNEPKRDIGTLTLGYFLWSMVLASLSKLIVWLFPGLDISFLI